MGELEKGRLRLGFANDRSALGVFENYGVTKCFERTLRLLHSRLGSCQFGKQGKIRPLKDTCYYGIVRIVVINQRNMEIFSTLLCAMHMG